MFEGDYQEISWPLALSFAFLSSYSRLVQLLCEFIASKVGEEEAASQRRHSRTADFVRQCTTILFFLRDRECTSIRPILRVLSLSSSFLMFIISTAHAHLFLILLPHICVYAHIHSYHLREREREREKLVIVNAQKEADSLGVTHKGQIVIRSPSFFADHHRFISLSLSFVFRVRV